MKKWVHNEFSVDEEAKGRLLKLIDDLVEWGYFIGKIKINLMVAAILDRKKVMETRFENNIPGDAWVNGISKRNGLS